MSLLKKISGANGENPSMLDGSLMTREEAEKALARWGVGLGDLKPVGTASIQPYLEDPINYDIGLRNLNVHLSGGNRVLFAEIGVQYKKMPYQPRLNFVGQLLTELGFLSIPETTRDLPMYFPSTVLIDRE